MALTQYCELEEVRAALGVNHLELSDAVLNLPVYEIGLVRELAKISASLPAAFLGLLDVPEASMTASQKDVFSAARLFCVYACAKQVGVSLASFAPRSVGDGKANTARFSDAPYKDTLDRVDEAYASARAYLVQSYLTTLNTTRVAATVPMRVFAAVGRSVDPVTGS